MKIFNFSKNGASGTKAQINTLGGKGAGLCEIANLKIPVPAGFIIPTTACMHYLNAPKFKKAEIINETMTHVIEQITWLKELYGFHPLLSVRSGARVSMPGMMDTILNVGLTEESEPFWEERLGRRAMLDSKRRLMQMMGTTAYGIDSELFEDALSKTKGVLEDSDLTEDDLTKVVTDYEAIYGNHFQVDSCFEVPLYDQLRDSIVAVWDSWNNPRAKHYRKMHGYSDEWGTAVTIQAMVFGNLNDNSCSGVLFTRCANTGDIGTVGEYLVNAQGEDVVAGIRTPDPLYKMAEWNETVELELLEIAQRLEAYNKDMQDIEFTIENGKVYILQTRNGKRSAQAAFKIAYDLYSEKIITKTEALKRVSYKEFELLQQANINPSFKVKPTGTGIPASGSVVSGIVALSAEFAINCTGDAILIAKETTPDDIEAMEACVGILTQTGGATSHAAVVARGLNKSCVVGCTELHELGYGAWKLGKCAVKEGDLITIDGKTGNVWFGIEVPITMGELSNEAKSLLNCITKQKGTINRITDYNGEALSLTEDTYIDTFNLSGDDGIQSLLLNLTIGEGVKVFLDMTLKHSYLSDSDKAFMGAFGDVFDSPYEVMRKKIETLNTHVSSSKKDYCLLLPAETDKDLLDSLVTEGWEVAQQLTTLGDVLDADGYIEQTPELEKNIGSSELTIKLLSMAAKSGKEFNTVPTSISNHALIHKTLG